MTALACKYVLAKRDKLSSTVYTARSMQVIEYARGTALRVAGTLVGTSNMQAPQIKAWGSHWAGRKLVLDEKDRSETPHGMTTLRDPTEGQTM